MNPNVKYLGIGLLIGLGVTALLLTGMFVPTSVAASLPSKTITYTPTALTSTPAPSLTFRPPTNTFTPTPTLIRLKTETPTSTPSITPTISSPTPNLSITIQELLETGYLTETGPLTLRQQLNIYGASVKFIRQTSSASQKLGEEINGDGYGSPTDICGPLSIAILQDAGIINATLDPHDFWLLNPDVWDDRNLILARAFPQKLYQSTRVRIKLDEVNWRENPLFPGDFIYIYAGTGGNFEHMLVVNRVDSEGRAYAVTNHHTPDGHVISEVLLYHPDKSNVGMFAVWAEQPNRFEGATGFGGYEIWRLETP